MKNGKKLLCLLLAAALLLCGCGGEKSSGGNTAENWFSQNIPEPEESADVKALKREISTVEEAVDYLRGQYPQFYGCCGSEYGDLYMHGSGQEMLQRSEMATCDIAQVLAYLLEDDLEVYVLMAYGYFPEGNCRMGPYTVLCIQREDHIEIVDAANDLPTERDNVRPLTGTFDSLEQYAEKLFKDRMVAEFVHYLYRMPGNGRYFLQTAANSAGTLLEEQAELLWDNHETAGPLDPEEFDAFDPLVSQISTVEEVASLLDGNFETELFMSAHTHTPEDPDNYWWLSSGAETVERESYEIIGRGDVVQAATYLLADDMEIYTVIGFGHSGNGGIPLRAINCIKTEDGYEFVDPVLLMEGDLESRYGTKLPEAKVSTLAEYVALCQSIPGLSMYIDYLYLFSDAERFEFVENERGVATLIPRDNCELLWDNTAKNDLSPEQFRQLKASYIAPEYISSYDLSVHLGGTTLSPDDARALVDAEAAEVKEQVKTAADLLMYMLAANIQPCDGCYCDNWGGDTWHTNMNARQVMQTKLGNCGSCANLANYLLEGDYVEVGFLDHTYYPGQGGGHVYNYIFHEGKYHVVDFSSYMFSNYDPELDHPIAVLNDLKDWGEASMKGVFKGFYEGICLIGAYTTSGQQLPCIYDDAAYWDTGEAYYYIPEGAEYHVLFDAGNGFKLAEKPFDTKYYDWTVFWGSKDRAPKSPSPENPDNSVTSEPAQIVATVKADPANIGKYDLSNYLGGTTLTPDDARALVDAKPEAVKEQVKTAADLLMYMMAADIQACDGCYCDDWDGDTWHTNMNARQVMKTKLGNCGSCANLANYLLEGDYEEVGFMDHAYFPGEGGSHVYNYILHEGKYYIVDFSWYMFGNYTLDLTYPIPVLDDLEQWSTKIRQGVFTGYYSNVNIIVSYTSSGQQLPVIFGEDRCYYLPEGADYRVLYQSPAGYKLAEKPFNREYYDWTVFWGEQDRAPKKAA